ncbi:hypothetical protein BJV77DRAFT_968051 [Russula vinacea]|nr:hypothetical protein BJV77DRAFT_968051 [Russula vinacea]
MSVERQQRGKRKTERVERARTFRHASEGETYYVQRMCGALRSENACGPADRQEFGVHAVHAVAAVTSTTIAAFAVTDASVGNGGTLVCSTGSGSCIPACFGEGGCEGDGKGKSCGAIRAEEERKQFRFPEEQVEPMEVPFLVERVSGVKFDRALAYVYSAGKDPISATPDILLLRQIIDPWFQIVPH